MNRIAFRRISAGAAGHGPAAARVRHVALWLALLVVALLPAASCSRVYVQAPAGGQPIDADAPLSVVYLIGDFGRPEQPFQDLTAVLRRDVEALADLDLRTAPMILELGDNLYEDGLPRDLQQPGARGEVDKLRAIAAGFAGIRHGGSQVPLVLIPGNHDYADDALARNGNLGDISRWYFLEELGIEGAGAWTHVPGDAQRFSSAAQLYEHLDGDAAAHAEFMAASPVPHLDPDIHVFAIDSELLLDLYDDGHDELAAAYWEELERQLAAAPDREWRFVATHHPPVTYGKHGEPSFGNWVFGQGWPQFPSAWQKGLAMAVPLGIVAGVVVHPAALVLSVATPLSTALVTGRKQDVGSQAYDRYAAELLRIVDEGGVDGIFSGHDHNTQFIELAAVDDVVTEPLLVITGAGSKVDPVRRGPGTVAFLSDYSYVRLTHHAGGLSFEIIDRQGESRYRYDLAR
jgi:hypothetical protein